MATAVAVSGVTAAVNAIESHDLSRQADHVYRGVPLDYSKLDTVVELREESGQAFQDSLTAFGRTGAPLIFLTVFPAYKRRDPNNA